MISSTYFTTLLLVIAQLLLCRASNSQRESGAILPLERISSTNIPVTEIKCILCDVDGTLTYGQEHSISDRSIQSIREAISHGYMFFPATGRSRFSMDLVTHGAISEIYGGISKTPGVYQQGLMVYGPGGDLIYEKTLSPEIIATVTTFCDEQQVSVVAYAGPTIYRREACAVTDTIEKIENIHPVNYPVGLDHLYEENIVVHKMIIMAGDEKLQKLRPALQASIDGVASLTQAVPGMLEVLPFGCSKGVGVLKLLEHIGISPENTVAFGDGENDVEMFEAVKFGIAVANAKPLLKNAARFVTESNADLGVALAIEKIIEAKTSIGNC